MTITVQAHLNSGASAIGQLTTYPPPIPPSGNGTGTIKGLGSAFYDLIGSGGNVDGTWSQRAGPVPGHVFNTGLTAGTIQGAGGRINGFGGAQLVSPEGTASSANTNVRVFIGTWNPASYAARTVNFVAAGGFFPVPQNNSLLVAYGYATAIDPGTQAVFTYDLYLNKYIGTNFGAGLNIPVVPAPSSLAILVMAALTGGGRARRQSSPFAANQ